MGAGGTTGVKTNGDRVVEILGSFADVSAREGIPADLEYTAQLICDALDVDPEAEFVGA